MSKNNHRFPVFITGIVLLLISFAAIFKMNTAFCGQIAEGEEAIWHRRYLL